MTYRKILVALDHSDLAEEVFNQALQLAQKDQAQLMLFHCIPIEEQTLTPYPSFYGEDMMGFSQAIQTHLERQEAETRDWLTQLTEQAEKADLTCEWDWKVGEAGRWIRDLAKSWEADLVVLGRRGLQGMAEIFLGSVSSYVVHHVQCSVLIVQQMKPSA